MLLYMPYGDTNHALVGFEVDAILMEPAIIEAQQ